MRSQTTLNGQVGAIFNLDYNTDSERSIDVAIEPVQQAKKVKKFCTFDASDHNLDHDMTSNVPPVPSKQLKKQWKVIDRKMQDSFVHQMKGVVHQIFSKSCQQLMTDHPLLESTLDKVIQIEDVNRLKMEVEKRRTDSMTASEHDLLLEEELAYKKRKGSTDWL